MNIHILTLFPEMFKGVFEHSIIARGIKNKIIKINLHNLRDWATDKHKKVDDTPYGGGAGMVLKVDVIDRALLDIKYQMSNIKSQTNLNITSSKKITKNCKLKIENCKFQNQLPYVVLLTPQGKTLNQQMVKKLSKNEKLILVCGHYEGFDERVRKLVDEEISIGQYVLTGGEIPAMVITDAVTRLLPGVLGKDESSEEESFSMGEFTKDSQQLSANSNQLLEYPHYTRPENYIPISKNFKRSLSVPKILLSGNHAKIKNWRIEQSVKRTKK